jgi:hypothetical protein
MAYDLSLKLYPINDIYGNITMSMLFDDEYFFNDLSHLSIVFFEFLWNGFNWHNNTENGFYYT